MWWPLTPYLPLARAPPSTMHRTQSEGLLQPLSEALPPLFKVFTLTQGKRITPKLGLWHYCLLRSQFFTCTEVYSRAQENGPDSSGHAPRSQDLPHHRRG